MARIIAGTSPPLSTVADLTVGDLVKLPGSSDYAAVSAIEQIGALRENVYAVATDAGTRHLSGREYAQVKLPTGLTGILGF